LRRDQFSRTIGHGGTAGKNRPVSSRICVLSKDHPFIRGADCVCSLRANIAADRTYPRRRWTGRLAPTELLSGLIASPVIGPCGTINPSAGEAKLETERPREAARRRESAHAGSWTS
ncbi:hypothetical protein K0M31_006449, partial [Melipona bicolor]